MPIKILHVIPNLGVGGTEKMLLELCRGLDVRRFENMVVALKSGGPTADAIAELRQGPILLHSADGLAGGLIDMPRLYLRLKAVTLGFAPDIVHTWLSRANFIGRLAAWRGGRPAVVSSLRVVEEEKGFHLIAERWTEGLCDAVTVNCNPLKDFAARRIGIPEKKIRVIFNGVRVPAQPPEREGTGPIVFGALGRLHRQKGLDVLLTAAREVLRSFPDSRFQIAGEGPERAALERLAARLGIGRQVSFLGLVDPPARFFAGIDVFVLASRWEGMPNVVLEAMAHRKAIVSTAVGGVVDLVADGKEGRLVPPRDAGSLARALCSLAADGALRRALAEAARRKAEQGFTLQAMVDAHIALYESLLSRR